MPRVEDMVLVELNRAAILAGRAGISVVSEDAVRADARTGSRSRTHAAISRLMAAGRVRQVRRGLLVLPDPAGLVDVGLLDLVAAVAPDPYLVTGGAALEAHRLSDQHFFSVAVLVSRPLRDLTWQGETAKFMPTSPERIWGGRAAAPSGAGRAGPIVAAPERALLDAIDHPRYGASLGQAVSALRLALADDPRFPGRLLRATRRYRSFSAARRTGFLVELLAGPEVARPFLDLIGDRPGPISLRPHGAPGGEVSPHWRVRVNADLDLVREAVAA